MITLAQVKKAYKAIDYYVGCGAYIDPYENKTCCPISALMIEEGHEADAKVIIARANAKFGQEFVLGFVSGFDGCIYNEVWDKAAFDNGAKIRKGLKIK